jgi:spore germination cell wall hydrolase CwlJ-like protein
MLNKIHRLIPVLSIALTVFAVGLFTQSQLHSYAQAPDIYASTITTDQRIKELDCLARNIYFESASEPFEGKVAVAQVTLNRVQSGQFASSICGVVYQKNVFYEKIVCQFSWYCSSPSTLKVRSPALYEESMAVAKKVLLENFRLDGLKTAMYYHADYVNPGWKKRKLTKIGRHIFYEG